MGVSLGAGRRQVKLLVGKKIAQLGPTRSCLPTGFGRRRPSFVRVDRRKRLSHIGGWSVRYAG
jgi:hypothetical protein